MPQELKESMRTTSHQVEIINRDRIKRNSGAEKYNIWNENFTIGTQKEIWAGRKKNQWTWR